MITTEVSPARNARRCVRRAPSALATAKLRRRSLSPRRRHESAGTGREQSSRAEPGSTRVSPARSTAVSVEPTLARVDAMSVNTVAAPTVVRDQPSGTDTVTGVPAGV